ncbi:hypothetical protein IQ235_08985 [Oscillatoriales cyanobacterium LEGE 11467]|uniref:Uncharacterized protein n=1 Tax=Zarconia navalis LEGE 11467 TaxID=1828826 RepID=A0A928Z6Z3_9CYAN|nr:hypothetical protein [Zarconia navalis]MBE9040912.1 hypothetical protein [Zarconia navalis LEGE 11467]
MMLLYLIFKTTTIPIAAGIVMGSTPIAALSETHSQAIDSQGIKCYENVPVDGENEEGKTTFLELEVEVEAIAGSEGETQMNADGTAWQQVELETGTQCWVNTSNRAIEQLETSFEISSFPVPNDRGNYLPSSPNHDRWEVTNRGLSGLNCYQTHPPNQGSHLVVSRLFNGHIMTAAESETDAEAIVEHNDRTWMAVSDPWSGQACWVRAHEDFIKPIE